MLKHRLWLDLETRSRVDLKVHGVHRYIACPDHRILVAGWALDDEPPQAVVLKDGRMPLRLRNILNDPTVEAVAHNAAFDRLQLGRMAPPIERWSCTATQARAVALPGKLEDLGRAVGANLRKDPRGEQLIKLLSVPQADGTFCDDPALMQEFAAYCKQDVVTMRAVSECLPPLDAEALRVYHASERINDRGLPIDTELCRLATQYAEAEAIEANRAVVELSRGALRTVRGTKLRDWVWDNLDPALRKHMTVWRVRKEGRRKRGTGEGGEGGHGTRNTEQAGAGTTMEQCRSLAVDIRATLLEIAAEEPDAMAPEVVAMIEAAEAGAMSSVAKFQAMLDRVSADGRLRGAFITNGAVQTGRWSSTGAQVHNFPRVTHQSPEEALQAMRRGEPMQGVLRTLKSLLRPAIRAGCYKSIVRADWAAVEARGLPWLADCGLKAVDQGRTRYLAAFADPDRDIYVEQSRLAGLGGERQPGKVVVLSLGYGGGERALARMAKNHGVTIPNPAMVVDRWRGANPWLAHRELGWWASLMRCAFWALQEPGKTRAAGRIRMCMEGSNLVQILPSGRRIHYPMARVEQGEYGNEISYLKASWKPKADQKEWPRARLWHGTLAENADQATCADLLRSALVHAEESGLPVVGHVHDEIICEGEAGLAGPLKDCMLLLPKWASGLPLAAETAVSERFAK